MENKKSGKPILSAICSAIIWGSGQAIFAKEYIKGLLLFLIQVIFISIELVTGYWVEALMGLVPIFDIRVHGGFFTKGIWGLITLGEVKREDHSANLMIYGVLAIIILAVILVIAILVIKDAYKTQIEFEKTGKTVTFRDFIKKFMHKSFAYVVLAPMAILFLIVTIMPIVSTILIAFTNYSKNNLPPANLLEWVGFENFGKLFTVPIWSSTFIGVLSWTVLWATVVTLGAYFFGLLQATLLYNMESRMKKVYQSILILPWAVPAMVTLLYLRTILNGQFGQLNMFLKDIGVITQSIPFLTDPIIAKITVIFVAIFLAFPSFMIMMLGVFSSADSSWYEAATIDGANKWEQFRYITFPHIFTATAPLLIMSFSFNFNGFGTIYFLTDGGPVNSNYQFAGHTDILISWIYDLTLSQQMFAMASVMSILIFIFVGALSIWNLKRTTSFKNM
ncbi:sugar ABC transporter permease [Candidatus Epulonipiscium fishelsonii]|uniref:Sugar ABC transporter permease n=1 Tax=Candidatus Epulonipiscium fishelsonii TaxID=77094 RepID=A0ACC8XBV6_9FIRM|nr:sugar ABC transporter permease [Epulopiscium sp. SCG-B05WGA-EpuloA1]ONI40027.1 sugar ABC transporter permease [Epulopiscium sp. SCG-B11WGA-EpuloA1]